MKRLTSELSRLFAESNELQNEIRKKLGAIGYEQILQFSDYKIAIVKDDCKKLIDIIPFGYTDIIGKAATSSNEYTGIDTVDL